jgi:nucleotide-binding universal stress UspA family protein
MVEKTRSRRSTACSPAGSCASRPLWHTICIGSTVMKAFRRIVVATDFSPGSRAALGAVEAIAKQGPIDVQLVHVIEGLEVLGPRAREYERSLRSQAESRMSDLATSLALRLPGSGKIATVVAAGVPAKEICRIGDRSRADLLILGSHGRTGFQRALIGSVAERVVRHAGRPVMVVPLAGSHRRR